MTACWRRCTFSASILPAFNIRSVRCSSRSAAECSRALREGALLLSFFLTTS